MDGVGPRGPRPAPPRVERLVWDPLVRLTHWTIAVAVLLNGLVVNPDAALHHWLGYAAGGALAMRLLWGVVGWGPARFAAFPLRPRAAWHHAGELLRGRATASESHNPLGTFMVYNIWASLAVVTATGVMMGTTRFFGVAWVEDLHGLVADWLLISAALHVGGVLIDQRLTGVGLVRAMITGRKRLPVEDP